MKIAQTVKYSRIIQDYIWRSEQRQKKKKKKKKRKKKEEGFPLFLFASRYSLVNPFSVLITVGRLVDGKRRFVDHYFRPRFFLLFCETLKRKREEKLSSRPSSETTKTDPVENNKAFCHITARSQSHP